MSFRYEAYNREAQRVAGVIEVDAKKAAEQILWDQGLTILTLKRVAKPFSLHEQLPSLFGVRGQDVIAFAEQLAILIEAGINVYMAVQIIRDQTTKPAFRSVLTAVMNDISGGQTLAAACGRHPRAFPPLFLRLLGVGEETGRLDVMLRRVAQYLAKQSDAGSKVKGALTYPIIVLSTAAMAMYILMAVALPNLIGLFKEFNAELPLMTRMVISTVTLAGAYGTYVLLGFISVIILFVAYRRTRRGRRRIDYFLVGTPLFGSLIVKLSLARLAETMATLISSGLALTESLDLLVDITRNFAVREPLQEVRSDTLAGSSLAQALSRFAIFPPMLVNLTRIGEETGTLESTYQTLGRIYSAEADRTIGRLIGLLEPALTILVGGVIGLVSITIISTIYSIMPQIK